jgi:hypothetical protein
MPEIKIKINWFWVVVHLVLKSAAAFAERHATKVVK